MIKEKELIVKLLLVLFPRADIYLFGSRARGTHTPRSDIDLAIDAHRALSISEVQRAKRILEALFMPEKIDFVDVNSVDDVLKKAIKQEGILWTRVKD